MWLSADKRRLLAKETTGLPYLSGASREAAHRASQIRDEILEAVFDQYIRPDDAKVDVSTSSRWKRARQLWQNLLTESRASYFVDLNTSKFHDWIRTGEATLLPCTTTQMRTLEKTLPALQGPAEDVRRAREIRAALLKLIEELERGQLERGSADKERQVFERSRAALTAATDAAWFLKYQPKESTPPTEILNRLADR